MCQSTMKVHVGRLLVKKLLHSLSLLDTYLTLTIGLRSLLANMKEKELKNKNKGILLSCYCGCKAQLMVQNIGNGQFMIDTQTDKRHRWVGVVLTKEDSKKMADF